MSEHETHGAGARPANELRIASWNVHMGLHNDGGRNDLVTECKRLDVDVLVMQEAWWYGERSSDLVEQVATAMGAEAHVYTSPTPMRRYPAQWTVAVLSTLPSERLDDVPLVSMRNRARAMVRVRLTELDITIAGAHLDGIHSARRRPDIWQRQRVDFRRHAQQNDIILGDLNMWAPVVERDARPLRNAISGPTWPWKRPHSQIDHILVSDRLDVVDGQVMGDMGSDHLAVRATLRTRAR